MSTLYCQQISVQIVLFARATAAETNGLQGVKTLSFKDINRMYASNATADYVQRF